MTETGDAETLLMKATTRKQKSSAGASSDAAVDADSDAVLVGTGANKVAKLNEFDRGAEPLSAQMQLAAGGDEHDGAVAEHGSPTAVAGVTDGTAEEKTGARAVAQASNGEEAAQRPLHPSVTA